MEEYRMVHYLLTFRSAASTAFDLTIMMRKFGQIFLYGSTSQNKKSVV